MHIVVLALRSSKDRRVAEPITRSAELHTRISPSYICRHSNVESILSFSQSKIELQFSMVPKKMKIIRGVLSDQSVVY